MNFFEQQDRARKKTYKLIFLFIFAILFIVIGFNIVIYLGIYWSSLENPYFRILFTKPLWIPITLSVLLVILLGSLYKYLRIAGGGTAVARLVKAKPMNFIKPTLYEKRFLNVVEEMAIASGVSMPKLYILSEPSINAFVAGIKPHDTVLVVTTGAIENLTRDELQAVVGHEFSHILNGDMRLNMRLMSIIGGLLVVGQIGESLVQPRARKKKGFALSRLKEKKGARIRFGLDNKFAVIAIALIWIGYIGLFFGRMIKAAISRERELLADSSSVQFTRNPHGLVSAFRTMLLHEEGTELFMPFTEDVSHFCFAQVMPIFFDNVLATHPPLAKRIQRLDPQNIYQQLPRDNTRSEALKKKKIKKQYYTDLMQQMLPVFAGSAIYTTSQTIMASIGTPVEEHLEYAKALTAIIPPSARQAASDPEGVAYLLYALLIPELSKQPDLLQELLENLREQSIEAIIKIKQDLKKASIASFLPLLDIALPTFSSLAENKRAQIFKNIEKIFLRENPSIFCFVLFILLEKRTIKKQKKLAQIPNINLVINEIAVVLQALLRTSHQTQEQQHHSYANAMRKLTMKQPPVHKELDFGELKKALQLLNKLVPLAKEQVIHACIECVASDGKILINEAELLRAIVEALECPLPPLLSNT